MKILRFYWEPHLEKYINDQVLTVKRETKTMLVGVDRSNPRYEYRFRKPANPQSGMHIQLVGKRERFCGFHYEICLEGGAI